MHLDPLVQWLIATALALLFANAALSKWRDLVAFRRVLHGYALLPDAAIGAATRAVPLFEAVLALLLCLPATRPLGGSIAAALLCAYAGAIGANLQRGRRHLDCGCGVGGAALSPWLLVRNAALALAALALVLPVQVRTLGVFDAFSMLVGIASIVLLYRLMDQLIANHELQRELLPAQAEHDHA